MREQKKQPIKGMKPPPNTRPEKAVTLHPLSFEEALSSILQVPPKPEGKGDWQKVAPHRKKR